MFHGRPAQGWPASIHTLATDGEQENDKARHHKRGNSPRSSPGTG